MLADLLEAIPSAPIRMFPDAEVTAATERVARGDLAAAATSIDRGQYPRDILGRLGDAGAFAVHLDRHGGRYGLAIALMEEIGRACGSTSFVTWTHDVCGLYLEQSGNPALTGTVLDDHASGRTFGGTALSNPMKAYAGIERMLLRARKIAVGYEVSGVLPWVSHIAPGHYCGAIAQVVGRDDEVSHDIMFLLRCGEHVELRQCPHFSGMEGTSTWGVRLDRYVVDESNLIADPAKPFIGRVRAAFVLLQTGMGLGVVQGSLDAMRAVERGLGHVNRFLDDRPGDLAAECDEQRQRIMRLAATPFDGSNDYLVEVLDARVRIAELALRASQSALLHQGARGYLMSSTPQRLIREAHFVAIVTPAIKHLRSQIAQLSRAATAHDA